MRVFPEFKVVTANEVAAGNLLIVQNGASEMSYGFVAFNASQRLHYFLLRETVNEPAFDLAELPQFNQICCASEWDILLRGDPSSDDPTPGSIVVAQEGTFICVSRSMGYGRETRKFIDTSSWKIEADISPIASWKGWELRLAPDRSSECSLKIRARQSNQR
ncbi:hypothetical protein ASE36_18915 [Rhizobium sp. Root274]|uniref:hypothetical protein n=1 Tax=unclassified Rhizobium TaxID=2613769 RepID=UPI000712BE37|nr:MULTISPECIES: hypothetical protein [unclassified Rhizobium]KQW27655.1 hypothetical protein ASC71_18955 [Rhizobium sp. Root1240]KRD27891.1 hypothetical protein ASE36_18915 [Rhizobium sp. Root274]